MNELGWSKSAQSLIEICAFLAGIGATLFILILSQKPPILTQLDLAIVLTTLIITIALFAIASEGFTDALEFHNSATNVWAVLAHDAAVTALFLTLSIIVWAEGYGPGTAVAAAFSSYFSKDVIWLSHKKNRRDYQDWLDKEQLGHVREKPAHAFLAALCCGVSAIAGAYYLYNVPAGLQTTAGFFVMLSIGYTASATVYLFSLEFLSDVQFVIFLGTVLALPALVLTASPVLLPSALLALIGFLFALRPMNQLGPTQPKPDSGSNSGLCCRTL